MFIDEVKVYTRAGHGGKGCVAFHREAYRPKGGPSGGNGGQGGNVILQADHDLNNLIQQFYTPRLIAEDGHPGLGKGMDGHAGKDLLVKVPCGTIVWRLTPKTIPGFTPAPAQDVDPESDPDAEGEGDSESDGKSRPPMLASSTGHRPVFRRSGNEIAYEINLEQEAENERKGNSSRDKGERIADLTEHGQQFVLAKSGRGGLGNRNFATSRRQAPRFAQPGEPGEEGEFLLELRTIAEVGIVGYPNAGKSTLLAAISQARPKVAPYPFTTLTPQIGMVDYPKDYRRITVCDVPGLIEGAHNNVGLGHAFLRHIERCKILVMLIDMAGVDGRKPWDDYRQLLQELELYDPGLLKKPRYIVANKMDEPPAEANLKQFKRKVPKSRVLPIAAAFDEGIAAFKTLIRDGVDSAKDA
ncbi:MAG: GTPase ObgE [Verrucomicrobia bacterium]|nr:GTPase ObgE [Verrucomicrobiota bacterium]MBI3870894.1 GTPase ObgE [Verrucomicrobiota bacterium]